MPLRTGVWRRRLACGSFVVLALAFAGSAHGQRPATPVPQCDGADDADTDRDGLGDACELALAHAFAPTLIVRAGGCNWDASGDQGRLGGGYFHAVQPVGTHVRVAYLPAYFRDCGWRGAKCLLPWIDCAPHDGDSEAVVIELQRGDAGWTVTGVFLSAHCFGRSTGGCRWFRGAALAAFQWRGSGPMVWVAEGRHANYPSSAACDAGHFFADTCDRHDSAYVFPLDAARNIGSRYAPIAAGRCVSGSSIASPLAKPDAVECFWEPQRRFRGWQEGAPGVTPYARYLRDVAEF